MAEPLVASTTLPAGTVMFLFTDIEGSTRLVHELGPETAWRSQSTGGSCARRSRGMAGSSSGDSVPSWALHGESEILRGSRLAIVVRHERIDLPAQPLS